MRQEDDDDDHDDMIYDLDLHCFFRFWFYFKRVCYLLVLHDAMELGYGSVFGAIDLFLQRMNSSEWLY